MKKNTHTIQPSVGGDLLVSSNNMTFRRIVNARLFVGNAVLYSVYSAYKLCDTTMTQIYILCKRMGNACAPST